MDVVVAGQGYVGLPLAVRAAEVGHRVVSYDVDLHRIKRLTVGESYVEDVTSSRLRAVLDSGASSATADVAALAGGSSDAAGLLVGVAEHPGDDRCRCLKNQVPQCGGPAIEGGDLVGSQSMFDGVGGHRGAPDRLSFSLPGEDQLRRAGPLQGRRDGLRAARSLQLAAVPGAPAVVGHSCCQEEHGESSSCGAEVRLCESAVSRPRQTGDG
ncbi:hypothetical protein ACQPYK_24495 [Streptosporangium sp. CA-135522]|uniref:hypothetical protein n=1 Tax=Streptosporangium sp. CA-135522 TaxID=3240072 RepID=UPI003D8DF690